MALKAMELVLCANKPDYSCLDMAENSMLHNLLLHLLEPSSNPDSSSLSTWLGQWVGDWTPSNKGSPHIRVWTRSFSVEPSDLRWSGAWLQGSHVC